MKNQLVLFEPNLLETDLAEVLEQLPSEKVETATQLLAELMARSLAESENESGSEQGRSKGKSR